MARRIVDIAFVVFFGVCIYTFQEYEKTVDQMFKTNDMLLHLCMASKLQESEMKPYK